MAAGKAGPLTKAPLTPKAEKPRSCWRDKAGHPCACSHLLLGSSAPLWPLQWGDEVKEVLIQFLIPSANYQILLVVVVGLLSLSGGFTLFVFVCCTWIKP